MVVSGEHVLTSARVRSMRVLAVVSMLWLAATFGACTVVPVCAGGLLSPEAASWLPDGYTEKIEAAIAKPDADASYALLVEALKKKGLDLDEKGFQSAVVKNTPPPDVLFTTVILSVLTNNCNFGYAMLDVFQTLPDERKKIALKTWSEWAEKVHSSFPGISLITIFCADGHMRNNECAKADECLRQVITSLQDQKDLAESRLLSLSYCMAAQLQFEKQACKIEDKPTVSEPSIGNDIKTPIAGGSDSATVADKDHTVTTAAALFQNACGLDAGDVLYKPTMAPLGDARVSYALFCLSKYKFSPALAKRYSVLALKEDPSNLFALLILSGLDGENPMIREGVKRLVGSKSTWLRVDIDLARPFAISTGARTASYDTRFRFEMKFRLKGAIAAYERGINFDEMTGSGVVAGTLSYPGMLRITRLFE